TLLPGGKNTHGGGSRIGLEGRNRRRPRGLGPADASEATDPARRGIDRDAGGYGAGRRREGDGADPADSSDGQGGAGLGGRTEQGCLHVGSCHTQGSQQDDVVDEDKDRNRIDANGGRRRRIRLGPRAEGGNEREAAGRKPRSSSRREIGRGR